MRRTAVWQNLGVTRQGSRMIWLLVAPMCWLIDGRFRRYVEYGRYTTGGPSAHPGMGLPNRDSITSWNVRGKQSQMEVWSGASAPVAKESWLK